MVEGEWIIVPIIVVGRWGLGVRTGGTLGVMMLVGWRLESDDGGNGGLDDVLATGFLVLRNWLRRGSCGTKSSA